MSDIFLAPGLRTPFVRAGRQYAPYSALELSRPLAAAMAARAQPDFVVWSQVIPDPLVSNIARELVFEAGLDPEIPAFSTILACGSSMAGTIQAGAMIARGGGAHLALVGGVETMSHSPIALRQSKADELAALFAKDPAAAVAALQRLDASDFSIPAKGWVNKQTGRSQGEHTEDTAKHYGISREDQDQRALASHRGAIAGQDAGFFDDLLIPFGGVERDTFPRRDTSLEKLATLPPAFDTSGQGTLTAGNSSPLTDGAASLWVGDGEGLARLGLAPTVRLVDWRFAATAIGEEGILMAPARAIPRLLSAHGLTFGDITLWEIHEAFATQVLANIRAASDPAYRRTYAKVDADLGAFPWDRVNPNGGSLAIGHPFAATGARILSQAAKELAALSPGAYGIVSVCADGGEGIVALLQRV